MALRRSRFGAPGGSIRRNTTIIRRAPVVAAPKPKGIIQRRIIQRATVIPYYDPSRVIKDIKVVADLRQSGTERGETQTGDNGTLGPESIAPPRTETSGTPIGVELTEKNNFVPIALAVAAFILLGG